MPGASGGEAGARQRRMQVSAANRINVWSIGGEVDVRQRRMQVSAANRIKRSCFSKVLEIDPLVKSVTVYNNIQVLVFNNILGDRLVRRTEPDGSFNRLVENFGA